MRMPQTAAASSHTLLCRRTQKRHRHSSSVTPCPYTILGVPRDSSLDQVKRAFVKLALTTHPDQQGGSTQQFLRIRQAWETIQNHHHHNNNSGSGNRNSGPSGWSTRDIRQWWQQETGEFLSFDMTESTRREVIAVFRTMGHTAGGRDKGGYWEMARQLTEREDLRQQTHNGGGGASGEPPVVGQIAAPTATRRRRRR